MKNVAFFFNNALPICIPSVKSSDIFPIPFRSPRFTFKSDSRHDTWSSDISLRARRQQKTSEIHSKIFPFHFRTHTHNTQPPSRTLCSFWTFRASAGLKIPHTHTHTFHSKELPSPLQKEHSGGGKSITSSMEWHYRNIKYRFVFNRRERGWEINKEHQVPARDKWCLVEGIGVCSRMFWRRSTMGVLCVGFCQRREHVCLLQEGASFQSFARSICGSECGVSTYSPCFLCVFLSSGPFWNSNLIFFFPLWGKGLEFKFQRILLCTDVDL